MYLTMYVCCFRCKHCQDVVVENVFSSTGQDTGEYHSSKTLRAIYCHKPGEAQEEMVSPMIFCPHYAPSEDRKSVV